MALHTELPIYRTGLELLTLAHSVQEQMPRGMKRTLATALQRIAQMPDADTYAAGNSYLGLVRQASHSHQERAAVCRALLKRGHSVEGLHLTKAFRKGATA